MGKQDDQMGNTERKATRGLNNGRRPRSGHPEVSSKIHTNTCKLNLQTLKGRCLRDAVTTYKILTQSKLGQTVPDKNYGRKVRWKLKTNDRKSCVEVISV